MHTPPEGVTPTELKEMVKEVTQELQREPHRSAGSVQTIQHNLGLGGCAASKTASPVLQTRQCVAAPAMSRVVVAAPTRATLPTPAQVRSPPPAWRATLPGPLTTSTRATLPAYSAQTSQRLPVCSARPVDTPTTGSNHFVNLIPHASPPQQFRHVPSPTPRSMASGTPRSLSPPISQQHRRSATPPQVVPTSRPMSPKPLEGLQTVGGKTLAPTASAPVLPGKFQQPPTPSFSPPAASRTIMPAGISASQHLQSQLTARRTPGIANEGTSAPSWRRPQGSSTPAVSSTVGPCGSRTTNTTSPLPAGQVVGSLLQSMEASSQQLARLTDSNMTDGTAARELLVTAANTVSALAQTLQEAASKYPQPEGEPHRSASSWEPAAEDASPEDVTLSPPPSPSPIAVRKSSRGTPSRPQGSARGGGGSAMSSLMASPSSTSTLSQSPLRSEKTQSPCPSGFADARTAACAEPSQSSRPAVAPPEASVDSSQASEVTRQLSFRVPGGETATLDWAATGVDWASKLEAKDKELQQKHEELQQAQQMVAALQQQLAASNTTSRPPLAAVTRSIEGLATSIATTRLG